MDEHDVDVMVIPAVEEYEYPEPLYSEKAQAAEYQLDAAIASMRLQLGQLLRRRRELDRNIDDLQERLKGVD